MFVNSPILHLAMPPACPVSQVGDQILDKLAETDLSTVHNKNGFLATIMRRFRGYMPIDPARNQQAAVWRDGHREGCA